MSRLGTSAGPWLVEEGLETTPTGNESFQVWEGSASEVAGKRLALIAAGASRIKYNSKGDGNYEVRASWSYDYSNPSSATYTDTLELETNLVQRSIYQSPVYRARFSDFVSATQYSLKANKTLSVIKQAAHLLESLQPTLQKTRTGATTTINVPHSVYEIYNIRATTPTAYSTAQDAAVAYLLNRLGPLALSSGENFAAQSLFYEIAFMGVTNFWEFGTVFRRTVTAAVPSAIQANYAGVGMIWTSAEVSAFEGIPTSGGWFTLPANKQWIKDKPRVLKAYGQKTQLSYNYTEIISASANAYQAYGTATLIHT